MAFNIADRVKETTTTTGTGSVTLLGAVVGYQTFSSAVGNGNTCYYTIQNTTETEWEVGLGTVSAGVLSRDTVLASSNSGALVIFSSGTKYVFNTEPAIHLKSLVPYTGATASVNLGTYGLTSDFLQLSTTPTSTLQAGRMQWNDTDGTMDLRLKGNNVTLQVGQELVARVVNKTGASLTEAAYQVVRISSAQGQRLAVQLAQGNNDANSAETLGIVTETIANNQEGFITTSGLINGINTTGSLQGETWADGDMLYLSPTTAGAITKTRPTAPNHTVILGYVVYAHANNGKIFVKIDNGYEIGELHDVYAPSPSSGNGLFWNATNQRYELNTISGVLGYTPADDSLVMKLAGSQTATGYKTFSIGLQTNTGDNYLNYSSGNTNIGYGAAPSSPLKLNVKDTLRVEYTANRYVDIKVNPSLSDYAYLQASNTTGFSIVSSGTLFLRPNDASNTIYLGSYIRQQDITASALYGSSSLTGRGFEIGTNVPMVFKTTIDAGGGVVGAFIFHSSDNANFAHRVTASTTSLQTIKTTGQLQLHNYTSTSVFTGTIAGLLGFDSSGNVITSAAGVTGSGTAGQVTYWSGTSAVTGSTGMTWNNSTSTFAISGITNLTGTGTQVPLTLSAASTANNTLILKHAGNYNAIQLNNNAATPVEAGVIGWGNSTATSELAASFYFLINRNTTSNASIRFTGYSGSAVENYMTIWGNTKNVIINGTTDAGYRLDINGTGAITGALRVTGGNVQFGSATGLNWDNTNSRLGIGTSSPGFVLDIAGNTNGLIRQHIKNSSNGNVAQTAILLRNDVDMQYMFGITSSGFTTASGLQLGDAFVQHNDVVGTYTSSSLVLRTTAANAIKLQTNSTTRMTIKSDGKINITSLPTSSAGLSAGDLWNNSGVINIV